jgi:hypothetical protein
MPYCLKNGIQAFKHCKEKEIPVHTRTAFLNSLDAKRDQSTFFIQKILYK